MSSKVLQQGLQELNITVSSDAISKLELFKNLLLEWNQNINLTAITDPEEVDIKHFIDSATCLATGYIRDNQAVIDIGTGAGFPGIPIKILNNSLNITLLDSLNKRLKYLQEVVNTLQL
jgi:16S rRNA (guanine527-N7)-methyltransferase